LTKKPAFRTAQTHFQVGGRLGQRRRATSSSPPAAASLRCSPSSSPPTSAGRGCSPSSSPPPSRRPNSSIESKMLALFFSAFVRSPREQFWPHRIGRTGERGHGCDQNKESGAAAEPEVASLPASLHSLYVFSFSCIAHRTWKWRWNDLIPLRLPKWTWIRTWCTSKLAIFIIYSQLTQKSEWRSGSVVGP
jgi:hypothetical protein